MQSLVISTLLIFFLLSGTSAAGKSPPGKPSKRVILLHTWSVNPGNGDRFIDLEAKAIALEEGALACVLKIFQDGKLIYTDPITLFPRSLFHLDNDVLAALWTHANGARKLCLYDYQDGKVKKLLDLPCTKLDPEFVYPTKGHIYGSYDKETGKAQGGPYYLQRIIVPCTNWTTLPKPYLGSTKDLQPITADVYTWNEAKRTYTAEKNIPWTKRLQHLGGSY